MSAPSVDVRDVAGVLDAAVSSSQLRLNASFWGFGGIHGGLSLALLTSAMRRQARGRLLRSASAQFKRPLREQFEIEVSDEGGGRTASWFSARAMANGAAAVVAQAIFTERGSVETVSASPSKPWAPSPAECPVFTVPPEFVPFSRRIEIRPVGPARPFIGDREPELMAWLRLLDDDVPPDDVRLIVLMDSLAPAYAAVLHAPAPMPTVTYSVTFGAGLADTGSPWILLRTRANVASRDGWVGERLDAWGPDGQHLGAGEQLRVLVAKP